MNVVIQKAPVTEHNDYLTTKNTKRTKSPNGICSIFLRDLRLSRHSVYDGG